VIELALGCWKITDSFLEDREGVQLMIALPVLCLISVSLAQRLDDGLPSHDTNRRSVPPRPATQCPKLPQ